MHYLGVDTGGTFTDFVALDAGSGDVVTFKVPSMPADPARAIVAGLERLRDRHGVEPEDIGRFIFGTTVATNSILELKGANTALVTTLGTRDVIEIQRLWRHHLFDLYIQKRPPLVPRRARIEVDERVGADGGVVRELSDAEAARIAGIIADGGYDSVAISLIFAFLAPDHERRLRAAILARCPGMHVSISSDVSPEFREYERSCTTVMNAYVMPAIHRLVERLEGMLAEAGCGAELRIIQSNGGLMNAAKTRAHPVHTLLSGPAGGVVGAAGIAGPAGHDDIITMDMGGTSLDICLIQGGDVTLSSEGQVGGFPVQVPQVNVHTIGAGGGSIARVIRGALKVGPESAGAEPGPVCYGRGGAEPTSTDAAVALGFIDPDYFVGGEMTLDVEGAKTAVAEKVGVPLGLAAAEAAMAIVRVQTANMATGIRAVSVQQGLDPRGFTLLPFGGAGALYAGLIAAELGIGRILVPVQPSVLSALGMLLTDVKYTEVATRLVGEEDVSGAVLTEIYGGLEDRLTAALAGEGIAGADVALERSCDMRYRGQAYEINVPVSGGALDDAAASALVIRFHDRHEALYGQAARDEPVELVNYRVTGLGVMQKPELKPLVGGDGDGGPPTPKGVRAAYFGTAAGWRDCPVFERTALSPGATLDGPAIVEEAGATIILYPGHGLEVDGYGNLIIAVPAS